MPYRRDDVFSEVSKDGSRKALTFRDDGKGKRGASGTVYEHPTEPGKAIKLYHENERSKFEEKLRTMIKVKYNRPHIERFDFAWPESLILDGAETFFGFKMPFFGTGWLDLESLMQASEAEEKYGLGERDRLTITSNLALAIKELHGLGVYCIDLKPQNIRVNLSNLSAGIIDCDGMSVVDISIPNGKRFFADKSTPEFWAPENFGIKPEHFKDPEAHDRFALATIVFMLLNRGIHPYQGVMAFDIPGTETTAGKIKNNLYPYGAGNGRITPHQDSLYPFWHEETKKHFDRAFSTSNMRPSAGEWLAYLTRLNSEAEACHVDPKYHVKYPSIGCPVCNRDAAAPKTKQLSAAGSQTSISTPATRQPTPLSPWVNPPSPPPSPRATPLPIQPARPTSPLRLKWLAISAVIAAVVLFTYLGFTSSREPPASCAQQSTYDQAVRGGKSTIRNYIRECAPRGAFVQQASNALETLVYDESNACMRSSCNTSQCLQIYTADFSTGPRLASLRSQGETKNNSEECNPTVAERNAWSRAVNAGTIGAFQQYLNQYPNGPHAADARQRIGNLQRQADTNAWSRAQSAGTIDAFRQYLSDFPNGVHAADARQRIAQLQQVADDNAWAQANRVVSLSALRQYLNDFPNGKHAADAQRRIALIESVTTQFNVRVNTEITSNSPYNTQVFTGITTKGGAVIACGAACSRNPSCRAFTSDDYSCRIYNSSGVATAPRGGWTSGFR